MKRSIFILIALGVVDGSMAQIDLPPNGNNQKCEVSQYMGLVKVTVDYSSPHVKGRTIWGNVVQYGETVYYGAGKSSEKNPSPWRAGANENTTFTISHDVLVEGKPLHAGTYGLHMIPGTDDWVIIFSNNSNSWGSFFYTPDEDALRVVVKPVKAEFNEWLTYTFTDRLQDSSTLLLKWEYLAIPIKITVPDGDEIYFQRISQQFQSALGPQGPQFRDWYNWVQAANFCAAKKIHLIEAMQWLDNYLSQGARYYLLYQAKSQLLAAMGKQSAADSLMKEAIKLPDVTPRQMVAYGSELLSKNHPQEAKEVFLSNTVRNPESSAAYMGLAYYFSTSGDFRNALKSADHAINTEKKTWRKKQIQSAIDLLAMGKSFDVTLF